MPLLKMWLCFVAFPLAIGFVIYGMWRRLDFIDTHHIIFPLLNSKQVPYWVVYNLPDGLYAFALINSFYLIWANEFFNKGWWFVMAVVIMLPASEMFQKAGTIPGTFDIADLLAYVIAFIFSLFVFIKIKTKYS